MKTKCQPKSISGWCAAAFAGFVLSAAAEEKTAWEPVLQLRLRAPDTLSATNWVATRQMIFENPGCCDEVWFSTGIGVPPVSEHVRRAEVMRAAAADLRARGIAPALQFQATIGHSDELSATEDCSGKTWGGWTGSTGAEARYCNCPRQPGFLAYVRETARAYAGFHPASVWIDDDLRYEHHRPATDRSHIGCWCATCLEAFNAKTGGSWTRASLAAAVGKDAAVTAAWQDFSIASLEDVARAVAEEFHRVSPETRMALQHGMSATGMIMRVLATLEKVSGHPVGMRPGGGAYYDVDPNAQVLKSLAAAQFRRTVGDPAFVQVWTPEVESWPRTYGSRSAQSVIVETFTGFMYGLNAASWLVTQTGNDPLELSSRTMMRPLAEAAPVLRGYARANRGTHAVGFTCGAKVAPLYAFACAGVPVLFGVGTSCGELTQGDLALNRCTVTSAVVQKKRDELDARAGGSPAVVESAFVGLVLPRVTAAGKLRTVALLNVRIDGQGPVRLRLRNLASGATKAVWHEVRHQPVDVPIEDGRVVIPSIGAWNGGYLACP